MWLGKVEGGTEGVVGGVYRLGVGGDENGLGLGKNRTVGEWSEVHPVVGVFVAWGCAMVSRSIHIPKP